LGAIQEFIEEEKSDMQKILTAGAFLLWMAFGTALSLQAQDTFHIFPQIADGTFSDGSYYKSTFLILPWFDTDAAACSLRLYGLSATLGTSGPSNAFTINVPVGGYYAGLTAANQPLKTGYATLTCSDFVYAQLLYSAYSANGTKVGEATVFSSQDSYFFKMILDYRGGSKLGIAISNNTDITHTYELTLGSRTATVTVGARSSVAKFVDQLMSVPADTVGILNIEATDFSEFSAIGLRYTGPVFATIPAN